MSFRKFNAKKIRLNTLHPPVNDQTNLRYNRHLLTNHRKQCTSTKEDPTTNEQLSRNTSQENECEGKKKSSREEQNPKRSYKGGVLLEFKNFVGCTSNSASAQSNTPQRKQAFLDNLQNNFSFILEIGQITYSIMCLLYKFAFTISIPAQRCKAKQCPYR